MSLADNLLPKRAEWLARLVERGPLKCEYSGSVGYGCRILGWTEWAYVGPDGELLPASEAERRAGAADYHTMVGAGYILDREAREFITQEGRLELAAHWQHAPKEAP